MYLIRLSTLLALAALLVPAAIAQAAPAEDAYAAAAGLYSAQQWEQAAEALGQFLAQYPDHERATVARFYRGEALAQLGRHESAASLHGEFLTLAPQHALARVAAFRVGECLLLAGKGDEAKTRLEEFRRSHPQDELNAFALPYLGEIALAAGKTAEAEDLYVQALSDYPSGLMAAESRFGLASCRQKSGQAADAIALYQQVATDTNHALADDARLRIGLVHYDAQQFADAEESFSAFRTTFAESQLAPQARYWLGMSQQAQGRAAEAAATLAAAAAEFEQAEQAPALHAAAGDAFRHAGDTARADAHFQRLIADWPQSEWADDALLGRAELALAAGEADRAATLAAELAEKYPQSPHAGLAGIIRARSLLAEEQFAAAEELLQPLVVEAKPEAATDGPPAASAANHQLAYLLALAQIGQKKHEAALASLDKIGDLPEGDSLAAPVAEARCSALLGLERFDDAAALLQQRIESDSGGEAEAAELSVQLVVALARSGKLGQAVAQIQNLPQNAVQSQEVAAVVLLAAEEAYKSNNLPTAESLFTLAAGEGVPAAERSLALSGLAWTQYRRSGKQASAATFDRLLRDFPSSPLAAEAALVRAKSLEDVKQYDAAISTYRLIIDKYATSPWLTHALWGAARLHDQLNQDREAAELLTRLVNDYPDFTHRDAALYQLGWVHADLQGHASSEAAHAQLLKEYPESEFWADAAYHLAEQAARRQENSRAIELTDQLLAHKSGAGVRENALYLRGQLAAAEGKWDEVARYMGDHALQYPASAMNLSARYWHAEAAFRIAPKARAGGLSANGQIAVLPNPPFAFGERPPCQGVGGGRA
ncbi:MAG TPA: tetratricopeptide repeat protein [Pirellulaceae bacterium]|nr:tetratricopeptide repeat protein [Pirellulaceae bacterium]